MAYLVLNAGGLAFPLEVAGSNTAPSISSTAVTTATVGSLYTYTVTATDAGDTLVFSLPTKPTGMTIGISSGVIQWTPSAEGTENVVVRVTDLGGLWDEQSFSVEVAPAAFIAYADGFDGYSAGGLPAGWSEWHNTGTNLFSVVDRSGESPASPSLPNMLSTNLQRYCRAWPTDRGVDTDCEVSATVQVASTNAVQTGVFARASGHDGASFSGYIASSLRNGGVTLYRLDGNTATVLASVASGTFITTGWQSRITIRCLGSNIRVQQYAVSGSQAGKYLGSDGTWGSSQAWAINVTDATYSSGVCGITKHNNDALTDYFDDFAIDSAAGDSTPPSVTLTGPADGATLSGTETLTATASDAGGIQQVEFLVDGVVRGVDYSTPFTLDLNTESLTNGTHVIAAKAYDLAGNSATSTSISVTVSNLNTVTRPTITYSQSHLRLMSLAYSNTPMTEAADTDVASFVDVCVTNPSVLTAIRAENANTHHMLYFNIGNIYLSLIMDWLNYADTNTLDREKAFYHAASAGPVSGNTASTTPARQFWQCFTGASGSWTVHQTEAARWTATAVTLSGTNGQSTYFGYPEKFREINFASQTQDAGGGWAYVLEYPVAVNGSGEASSWSTITPSDSTSGLTTDGQLYWNPPTDWVPAKIASQPTGVGGSSYRYYYVRMRVTSGGTAPAYSVVSGRDFTGQGLTSDGTIPAFDSAADADADGYLSDAEYATRASGKDARAWYESRIPGGYGIWRYAAKVGDSDFVNWAKEVGAAAVAGTDYSGLFMDNSFGRAMLQATPVESYTDATYAAEYGSVCRAIWNNLASHSTLGQRWVLMNTAGETTTTHPETVTRCPAWWLEFELRPHATGWASYAAQVAFMPTTQALTAPEPIGCYDSALTSTTPSDQELHDLLCCYYQLSTAGSYLCVNGGNIPAGNWRYKWTDSYAFNVGQPVADTEVWATGTDPSDGTRTYKVYRRVFDNAVVLFKPLSSTGASGDEGTTGASTATTHALGATYKAVGVDGVLGSNITSIDLENGEGAILVLQ